MPRQSGTQRCLLKRWRRALGIKQENLARKADLHVVTLSRIETGTIEPGVNNALKICRALSALSGQKLRVEEVFGFDEYSWPERLGKLEEHLYDSQHRRR